jgi:zinc transporter ZupT
VIGYALFVVISRYVAHVCPACAASHTETVFRQVTWVMVIALSIHCVMDGLALAASGGSLAIAVFVHKVPEGLALTGVALAAGWNPWRALGLTFLIEAATTVAGVSVGMFTHVQVSPVWLGWVMAHVSGGFLFLAGHAIINELMRHRPRATTIAATLGALTLLVLQWLVVGDTHAH